MEGRTAGPIESIAGESEIKVVVSEGLTLRIQVGTDSVNLTVANPLVLVIGPNSS